MEDRICNNRIAAKGRSIIVDPPFGTPFSEKPALALHDDEVINCLKVISKTYRSLTPTQKEIFQKLKMLFDQRHKKIISYGVKIKNLNDEKDKMILNEVNKMKGKLNPYQMNLLLANQLPSVYKRVPKLKGQEHRQRRFCYNSLADMLPLGKSKPHEHTTTTKTKKRGKSQYSGSR